MTTQQIDELDDANPNRFKRPAPGGMEEVIARLQEQKGAGEHNYLTEADLDIILAALTAGQAYVLAWKEWEAVPLTEEWPEKMQRKYFEAREALLAAYGVQS